MCLQRTKYFKDIFLYLSHQEWVGLGNKEGDQIREAKFISDPKDKHGMDNGGQCSKIRGNNVLG